MWCFIRISVKYIDRELERIGCGYWAESDNNGLRIGTYALAILSERISIGYDIRGADGGPIGRRVDYVGS